MRRPPADVRVPAVSARTAPRAAMTSIRRNLLGWLLAALAAGLLAAAAAVYLQARADANQLFDYHLRQVVASLPGRSFPAIAGHETTVLEDGTVIQIWDQSGAQLYFSHPLARLPDRALLGFSTVDTQQGRWRVFSAIVGSNVVQAAQPMNVRADMAAAVALRTTMPFLILLPLLAWAIMFAVRRGLAPLDALAADVATRSAQSLAAVPEAEVPEEVRPLVQSLNGLLSRLAQALAGQRAFVADAAHELRTPLTALKLQMRLLGRARDEAERQVALADLEAGLARAAHLVDQLLTLARQEPTGSELAPALLCDLATLAREVVASRMPLAIEARIDLGVKGAGALQVTGDRTALAVMLGNLVDNALRYTPAGGTVDVEASVDGQVPMIAVCDTGPGIAAQEKARVFDRFYRVPGSPGTGSGLGLAIVRQIADRHGASVALDDRSGGGLCVRVRFTGAN